MGRAYPGLHSPLPPQEAELLSSASEAETTPEPAEPASTPFPSGLGPSAGMALRRRERLRGRLRIDELFSHGRFGQTRLVTVRSLPNDLSYSRVAVLAAKAAGGAVVRNRLRRRFRAAFRLIKWMLPANRDFVILPRRGALEAPWPELAEQLASALTRAASDGPESAPPPPRERRRRR